MNVPVTKKTTPTILAIAVFLVFHASFGLRSTRTEAAGNTITLNSSIRYQTMTGWEGAILGAADYLPAQFQSQIPSILDVAVTDLGVTRARLSIPAGVENPTDWGGLLVSGQINEQQYNQHRYEVVNDNDDPNVINPAGFNNWGGFDFSVERLLIPARQRAAARGEHFYTNLSYVDFGGGPTWAHLQNPAEYAEFMLAAFQHLQFRYGFVPDGIEVELESDSVTPTADGTQLGRLMVATAQKLSRAGFAVPDFIAPSSVCMSNVVGQLDGLDTVSGARALLKEISYHRYCGVSAFTLQSLAGRATAWGKNTSMLEWWDGADYQTLHEDLKVGNNSAWEQGIFADAFNGAGAWVQMNGVAQPSPVSRFTRQYTKYIRPGAQRIDASTSNAAFDPVGFINSDGKYVVVVKAAAGGNFSIANLPAGTYGIFYTTGFEYDVHLTDQSLAAGQTLTTSIPTTGVITIYATTSGGGSIVTQPPPPVQGTTTPPIETQPSTSGSSSGSWVYCADEGQFCSFTGTRQVRYGTSQYNLFSYATLTGGTSCGASVFGDPAVGSLKQCWYDNSAPTAPPTTDTSNSSSSGNWVYCGDEGQFCSFTGTTRVRYGTSVYGLYAYQTLTGGTNCNVSVFGDPAPGALKQCWYDNSAPAPAPTTEPPPSSAPADGWVYCAEEGQFCSFSGTMQVRYGATQYSLFTYKTVTGGTPCTVAVFGDPALGALKQCWYRSGGGTSDGALEQMPVWFSTW